MDPTRRLLLALAPFTSPPPFLSHSLATLSLAPSSTLSARPLPNMSSMEPLLLASLHIYPNSYHSPVSYSLTRSLAVLSVPKGAAAVVPCCISGFLSSSLTALLFSPSQAASVAIPSKGYFYSSVSILHSASHISFTDLASVVLPTEG